MTEGTHHRLAAIVAADIVGYSLLVGTDEAGTLAAMRALRAELWDPMTEAYGGRLVGTAGDSRLVEFPSTVAAVECSVAIQRAMVERNAEVPEERRIRLRIGVNLGDVVVDGDDILGDGVNVAARLEGEAGPDGICVSDDVMRQVRGRLNLEFQDGGERDLKNIATPVRVWHWSAVATVDHAHSKLALPDKPSIAVLPFDNMSGDPEQKYFSDGITEDIITALSVCRWLFVTVRNSSFVYRGQATNIQDIARDLGVRYILEGSVRKAGNRVRITAQLIEAETGSHLWAQRYDRELEDVFSVQDEIAASITGALMPEIATAEVERSFRKSPENLNAWDYVKQGCRYMWRATEENSVKAQHLFRQAIELALEDAMAYGDLAFCISFDMANRWNRPVAESRAAAHDLARKAVELDDRDTWANAVLESDSK